MLFDETISKCPYGISVHRNNVTTVLLSEYGSDRVHEILDTSISVVFEDEKATENSGLTREVFSIFLKDMQERFFDGNVECIPRVNPQTCRTLSCTEDTMFTTMGKIISHNFVLTGVFPIFISRVSLQSVLVKSKRPIGDGILISSFLRYIDDFEKEAIETIMKENAESNIDDECLEIVLGVFNRCQSNCLPTRQNIRAMMIDAARSELVCRPAHALQALYKGMILAHPALWTSVHEEDLSKLYADLIPTPRRVWQLLSTVPFTPTRQEEKILDFLRRFVFSLSPKMLGLFLRFVSGNSYLGPKIKIGFNSQEPGFRRSPSVNTCSPHLHLPTSYA